MHQCQQLWMGKKDLSTPVTFDTYALTSSTVQFIMLLSMTRSRITHRFSQICQQWDNTVICHDCEVLLIGCNTSYQFANGGKNLEMTKRMANTLSGCTVSIGIQAVHSRCHSIMYLQVSSMRDLTAVTITSAGWCLKFSLSSRLANNCLQHPDRPATVLALSQEMCRHCARSQ